MEGNPAKKKQKNGQKTRIVVDKINDTPLCSAGGEGKTEKQTEAGGKQKSRQSQRGRQRANRGRREQRQTEAGESRGKALVGRGPVKCKPKGGGFDSRRRLFFSFSQMRGTPAKIFGLPNFKRKVAGRRPRHTICIKKKSTCVLEGGTLPPKSHPPP